MEFIEGVIAAPFICLGWIIIGALAGGLARSIMGSRDENFVSDVLLGILGAIIGGILAGIIGVGPTEEDGGLELVLINLVIATIGAMVLIALRRAFARA